MRQHLKYGLRVVLLIWLIAAIWRPLFASGYEVGDGNPDCTSFLVISGDSNINGFELIWTSDSNNKNKSNAFASFDASEYAYSIPVHDFKASNFVIYDDFIKLLKAEEFPRIVVKISHDQLNILKSGEYTIEPEISITLAGITKVFNIPCSVLICSDNSLVINGKQQLNLRDFQMIPPVKFNGLVKVKEEINVSFSIIVNFTDQNQNIASN